MTKHFQAPWTIRELILILTLSITLVGLGAAVFHIFDLSKLIFSSPYKTLLIALSFVVQWILILLPLLVFTHLKHKLSWKNFGFEKIGFLKTLGLVLWGYALFLGITLAVTILIVFADLKIPGYQVQDSILPIFGTEVISLVFAGLIIVLIAPIIEEIFFRGFLLRTFANKFGVVYASLISATIFALFHLQPHNIIPIFVLGLILNALVIKSKSLWPSVAFHMFNNAIAFIVQLLLLTKVVTTDKLF